LDFTLPDGKHTGYVSNVIFNDVNILVKGSNPLSDTAAHCPELGVGQYNASNLKTQPSYGIWARHVKGLTIKASTFNYEKRDSRYAICLDDVLGARISSVHMVKAAENKHVIGLKNSTGVTVDSAVYYQEQWGNAPVELKGISPAVGNTTVSFFKKK
jgi:hypothetical protein